MNDLSTIDCPHFGPCSGCTLSKNVNNPPIWSSIQSYFSLCGLTEIDPLEVNQICGWRTKAKLAVRGTPDHPVIGLFQAGTHDAMSIPYCQVHHPSINKAVEIIRQAIQQQKIAPYNETTGLLRYLQCLVDLKTGKIQLALVWNAPQATPALHHFADQLLKKDLWHSIWFNFQPDRTNRIFGDTWLHLHGPPFLQQSLGPLEIPFHPASFSQAHWTLFQKLAADAISWIPPQSKLLEIYAGVGALGLLAAPASLSVDLLESNPFAQLSFQAMTHPSNTTFHRLEAKNGLPLLAFADYVIVDPPRKGLDPALLNALKNQNVKLLYISCDFASFQRDLDQLRQAGYFLKRAKGYLLFPGTDHVEILAQIEKKQVID